MVVRSLVLFALAALAEIGGAWLVWQGWREHRGILWIAAMGVVSPFMLRTQFDPGLLNLQAQNLPS